MRCGLVALAVSAGGWYAPPAPALPAAALPRMADAQDRATAPSPARPAVTPPGGTAPAEPDDYRNAEYRAPVPLTLQGAEAIETPRATELWRTKAAIFVDVMPQPPRPEGLPADTYYREPPRLSLPGATWLPDTGYGRLSAPLLAYLTAHLSRLTDGDKSRPIVFFCRDACWMSWNAARRATRELGYTQVLWYRTGTDGWTAAGGELVAVARAPELP